jgi:hypothetical protein
MLLPSTMLNSTLEGGKTCGVPDLHRHTLHNKSGINRTMTHRLRAPHSALPLNSFIDANTVTNTYKKRAKDGKQACRKHVHTTHS